jgi:hypothetical protein
MIHFQDRGIPLVSLKTLVVMLNNMWQDTIHANLVDKLSLVTRIRNRHCVGIRCVKLNKKI